MCLLYFMETNRIHIIEGIQLKLAFEWDRELCGNSAKMWTLGSCSIYCSMNQGISLLAENIVYFL